MARLKTYRQKRDFSPMSLLLNVWPPMLASSSDEESVAPADHLLEVKYDGFRVLAAISNGKVTLQSRNGLDLSVRFPEIFRALHSLPASEAVLDGEVVALDEKGVASFQQLQNGDAGTKYFVFDLLWLDGEDLRARPLEERRDLLESVLANPELLERALAGTPWARRKKGGAKLPIELAERVTGDLADVLEQVKRHGGEGLIAKKRGSRYRGGRVNEWLKIKVVRGQELAVIGFTPISSGERMIGALHVGYRENGEWKWAGKVGTGYTDRLRATLYRTLSRTKREKPVADDAPKARDAVWVTPSLVAQVAFAEWTSDGKLRHPVFHGLRDDKKPTEVVRENAGSSQIGSPG